MKKYPAGCLITSIMLIVLWGSPLAAKNLKPRVLVIPFDNMMSDTNYNWMQGSISDNLKEKLIKTNRFEVMDVELLRQINPDIKFEDLTENDATPLAKKLNCEAAIIGRYIIKKKNDTMNALIQVEAVNSVSNESIVIKSEYTDLDGTVFSHIENLAGIIAEEFVKKLPPVDSAKNTRSSDLEKIIYRLEHPPKGFFDSLAFNAPNLPDKEKNKIKFKPGFDIDKFIYDLYLPIGVKQLSYQYQIWGKIFTPYITVDSEPCFKNECTINSDESEILISRTANRSNSSIENKNENNKSQQNTIGIYKIRIHRDPPPGPILGRWWISGGYPYTQSLSFLNPGGNPDALVAGGSFPLDRLNGVFSVETGFAPGRWQFSGGINWSIVAQFQYAKADVPLKSADSGFNASIDMFSMGGGLRIDRPFMIGNIYGISPMIGFYVHYQIFNHAESDSSFNMTGLNPEVGVIQYLKFGAASKWKISISTTLGSYLYENQNLSYLKLNGGIEYAFK